MNLLFNFLILQIRSDEGAVAIKDLTRVSGIGPAKAKELYDLGITNIDILVKNQDKLNHHQRLGLKYIINYRFLILL
jgi:DNA polymerase beta